MKKLNHFTDINNSTSTFDELLDKTNFEIAKSHGAIQKTFDKVCNGKNKKKDKKKMQKKLKEFFQRKFSQLASLIGKFDTNSCLE